jgi:hypothetical protein
MILMLRSFQFNALSHGNQILNLPYKKGFTRRNLGIQSTSVIIRNSALLLESLLLNINISPTTHFNFTSIYTEPAVTTHHQLINQEAIYTPTCVVVGLNFNSQVFQHTQNFSLGQYIPHSTFPTHHRLWDTIFGQSAFSSFLVLAM